MINCGKKKRGGGVDCESLKWMKASGTENNNTGRYFKDEPRWLKVIFFFEDSVPGPVRSTKAQRVLHSMETTQSFLSSLRCGHISLNPRNLPSMAFALGLEGLMVQHEYSYFWKRAQNAKLTQLPTLRDETFHWVRQDVSTWNPVP